MTEEPLAIIGTKVSIRLSLLLVVFAHFLRFIIILVVPYPVNYSMCFYSVIVKILAMR